MNERGGSCFPAIGTLAAESSASESTVRRAIKQLETAGFLRVQRGVGRGHTSIYEATFPDQEKRCQPDTLAAVKGVTVTPEDVREGSVASAPSPSRRRKADPVWDELERHLGPVTNAQSRGKRNKAVKLLKESGATPAQIAYRVRRYHQIFPGATLTDTALATHWDALAPPVKIKPEPAQVIPLPERDPDAAARAREVLGRLSGVDAKVDE